MAKVPPLFFFFLFLALFPGNAGVLNLPVLAQGAQAPDSIQTSLTLKTPVAPAVTVMNDATGLCTPGAHSFKVTYITAGGETDASPASQTVTCDATHTKVVLQVPTASDPFGGRNTVATGRNIYATKAGGSDYFLIAAAPVIQGNLEDTYGVLYTTYTFNLDDSSLTDVAAPTVNNAVNPMITVDNLGNVGIGTTTPVFVDDLQSRTLAVDGGKDGFAYIGMGSDTKDPNARVGGLNFYNWGNGGVDHRTAAIMSFNDGALGKGNLKFYVGYSIVGPYQIGMVNSDGAWSFGGHNSSSNTRLYLETFDTTPTGSKYLLFGAQRGGPGLFAFNDKGWLSINNANGGAPSPFSVGANADFSLNLSGKISNYANKLPSNGQLLIGNTATATFESATLTAGPGVTITNGNGSITIASSASGASLPTTTKGDLVGHNGTASVRVPVGANGQVLTADSTQPAGVKWANAPTGTGTGSGTAFAVQAWNKGSQSIPDSTLTRLAFDSTTADSTGTQHSDTTDNSRLTCRSAGTYIVHAEAEWSANAKGVRRIFLKANGTTIVGYAGSYPNQTFQGEQNQVTAFWNCQTPGEYIEMFGYQASGGVLSLAGGTDGVAGAGANTTPRLSWWKVF